MSSRYSMAGAWLVWDGLEPVHLELVHGAGVETRSAEVVPIEYAKRRSISVRERTASGGAYTGNDVNWWVPCDLLPTDIRIKPGDAVVDGDGVRWTALEVQWGARLNRWKLTCRDLVLHWRLRDTISVERAEVGYDNSGAAVKRWPTGSNTSGGLVVYADLPARVQPINAYDSEGRGVLGTERRFDVIVGRQLAVTREDRVRLASGEYLDIVGYRQAERIDELPILECLGRV